MTIRTMLGATVLSVLAMLSTGCSSAEPAAAPEHKSAPSIDADNPQELAAFIEKTVSYDFEPVPNPGLLRQASDIAVLGRVASVERTLLDTDAEDTGGVLISLTIDEEWKADPARTSEFVTYVIPRPTNVDVSVYRKALPVGTRVALFGYHTVETLVTGQPSDVVYDPAPQGLIFETGPGRAVNVWGHEVRANGWSNVNCMDELRQEALDG